MILQQNMEIFTAFFTEFYDLHVEKSLKITLVIFYVRTLSDEVIYPKEFAKSEWDLRLIVCAVCVLYNITALSGLVINLAEW